MRVLAIDGGGIRGIIPALVLAEVERVAERPVRELFDLIAGTSTGGILACALAKPSPRPAAELVELYRTEGPRIFQRSLAQRLRSGDGLLDEKHSAEGLMDVLGRYLGDDRLRECDPKVLITAYDLHAREPYFFKSWRPDRDARLVDAARATAAAPTYFEPLLLEGRSLVDGGVFAVNPSMCAYAEAVRLSGAPPATLLSLGTGTLTKELRHEDARGWGLVEWVRPVIDIVFDGVADTVDYQVEHLLGPDHRRWQVVLSRANDALDDASAENLERLAAHADDLIEDLREADQVSLLVEALTR